MPNDAFALNTVRFVEPLNSGLAGRAQPRAGAMRDIKVSGQGLAIFEADHLSSPLLKIAATFFDKTAGALA